MVNVRHIRNGTELEPLMRDDHYDFDYQQTLPLTKHRQIMPVSTFCVIILNTI
jgi:hypothetical protein